MKRHTVIKIILLFLILFAALGCQQKDTVAQFDGNYITVEEYLWEKDNLPEHASASIKTLDDRVEFVRKMVNRELLLEEALRQGLEYDETIRYKIESYHRNLLINELLKRELGGMATVTESEVKQYYNSNIDQFTIESLEASHILVKSREDAEMIMKLLEKGESFSELAKKFSIGPGAELGGSLGLITRGQMVPNFEDTVFSMEKAGEISPIIETQFGFHIIRLDKPKSVHVQSYEEVSEKIREILTEQKEAELFENYVNGLKEGIEIKINEELLKELG